MSSTDDHSRLAAPSALQRERYRIVKIHCNSLEELARLCHYMRGKTDVLLFIPVSPANHQVFDTIGSISTLKKRKRDFLSFRRKNGYIGISSADEDTVLIFLGSLRARHDVLVVNFEYAVD